MKRRNFAKDSSLLAVSVGAFGATQWNSKRFEGDTPAKTEIPGPFYRTGVPVRINIVPFGSKGD